MLDQLRGHFDEIQRRLIELDADKANKCDFRDFEKELSGKLDSVNLQLDKKENQIYTIENYVDKYAPIRFQSLLSEVLNEVITGSKEREALFVIEKKLFGDLHQALLCDNGVGTLLEQMHKINKDLGIDPQSSSSESQHSETFSSVHSDMDSIITEQDNEDSSLSAHSKVKAKNSSIKNRDGSHQKTKSKDKAGELLPLNDHQASTLQKVVKTQSDAKNQKN